MPEEKEPPKPIPIPDDFPFTWEDPSDAEQTWERESTHSPQPAPALAHDFWQIVFGGMKRASEYWGGPRRPLARNINTYLYMSHLLVVDEEEVEAADERAKKAAVAAGVRLKAVWDEEAFPAIQDHIQFWDGFDLTTAMTSDLILHIEQSWERLSLIWQLHFRLGSMGWRTVDTFNELYKELFEEEGAETKPDPFQRLKLTQGFPCKTTEMGSALWRLVRQADEKTKDLLTSIDPSKARDALDGTGHGQDFLKVLSLYLEQYGHRGRHWGIEHPTWIEDPAPVFETVKSYLANPDKDPDLNFEAQATEREEAVGELRERLQGYPEAVRNRFEELLGVAQFCSILKEDHNFWIDFSCTCRIRRVMLEAGRRLATMNVLDTVDEVFHLQLDECIQSLSDPNGCDRRQDVADRRAEIERFAKVTPPPRLGVEPPAEPKDEPEKPEEPPEPGTLKGRPGSPGSIRGSARIIGNPLEASHVEPGDIIVAGATAPSFTPFFAIAGGIVTEAGGLLSHCAIVAREYRIPAVVGVEEARHKISDGQLIEIDGTEGTVRLVDPTD